jgi:transposase
VKILYWDRDGLAQWYKRLEKGSFQFPTDGKSVSQDAPPRSCEIRADELAMLLGGIDLSEVKRRQRFERNAG